MSDETHPIPLADPPEAQVPYPRRLATALAEFQANLPEIRKNLTADMGRFTSSYASLDVISREAFPLLGSLGLSFMSRPTLNADREFVLRYSLLHSSGEREDGEYPLPDPAKTQPQQLGSAITYAKRYCLCAITGVAPHGDDDDGKAAQESGAPAASRRSQNPFDDDPAPRKAERLRATPDGDPWQTPGIIAPRKPAGATDVPLPDQDQKQPVTDQEWLTAINSRIISWQTQAEGNKVWAEVVAKGRAGGCTKADGDKLKEAFQSRSRWLIETDLKEKEHQAKASNTSTPAWPEGSAGEAAQKTGAKR